MAELNEFGESMEDWRKRVDEVLDLIELHDPVDFDTWELWSEGAHPVQAAYVAFCATWPSLDQDDRWKDLLSEDTRESLMDLRDRLSGVEPDDYWNTLSGLDLGDVGF